MNDKQRGCIRDLYYIVGIIVGCIAIGSFVVMHLSTSSSGPAPTPTIQVAPTPTPTPFIASAPTPTVGPVQSTPAQSSYTPIAYDSFWTWFLWVVVGTVFGALFLYLLVSIIEQDWEWHWNFVQFGSSSGVIVGTLFGFLSSLLINLFHFPYSFLLSIGAECVLVVIA